MKPSTFVCRSRFPVSVAELFDWHARPGAFERLTPAFDRVEILERSGGVADGARTVIRVPMLGPFRRRMVNEHSGYEPDRQFIDTQLKGPFTKFEHRHLFEADGP